LIRNAIEPDSFFPIEMKLLQRPSIAGLARSIAVANQISKIIDITYVGFFRAADSICVTRRK
jgi:hypothetical protein